MSSDRLSEMHEVIKDPLRQRILLKLGQRDSLDFDGLVKNLKMTDTKELSNQLVALQEMTVEGEPIVTKQDKAYRLTEKGHEVLDKMIAFPQLKFDNYNEKLFGNNLSDRESKPKPKWFRPYWIVLFISTVIVVGIAIPFFSNAPIDKTIFYLFFTLLILSFGYYIRVKPPSLKTNRIMYIVLFGAFFGCWFSIGAIVVLSKMGFHEIDGVVITTWIGCFALGGLLGDFIGRIRHYKGPNQYTL
jgi:hypothetical protein